MEKVKNNEKNYTFKPNIDEISNLIGVNNLIINLLNYFKEI